MEFSVMDCAAPKLMASEARNDANVVVNRCLLNNRRPGDASSSRNLAASPGRRLLFW